MEGCFTSHVSTYHLHWTLMKFNTKYKDHASLSTDSKAFNLYLVLILFGRRGFLRGSKGGNTMIHEKNTSPEL